jgi:hypothetical protein
MWRGARPDRNPLRRGSDRVETFIVGSLLVAAVAGAPVAAMAGNHWAYDSARQVATAERQTSYEVKAQLLAVPPTSPGGYSVSSLVAARARWTAHSGTARTGEIPVPADSVVGEAIPIWTDTAGNLTSAPLTRAEVADQGTFGTIVAIVLTLLTAFVAAGITRFVMNRRRMAAWAADWAVTGPKWISQRW